MTRISLSSTLQSLLPWCALTLAVVLNPGATAFAAPVVGDYDGDGRSDLSVSITYRDSGTSAWLTRLSGGGNAFWTFGVPGDAFVSGHYFNDNKHYPGVVYVRSASQPLEWLIKTPSANDVFLRYGLPGDHIPNQQDVDCDGITDFTVTRSGTPSYFPGFKLWYTALSGSGGQVVETVFGLAEDAAGLADTDGDNCAELVVLRPGTYVWYAKKLAASGYTAVQWGLNGDIPLWPADINGDGLADYIVVRKSGGFQQAYVRYGDGVGNFGVFTLGFADSIPQVGNFLGPRFFAWHQRNTGWVALGDRSQANNIGQLLQFGVAQNFIIRADGSVVPPTSDGVFPPTEVPGPKCSVTTDFIDGGGNALWKPISEVDPQQRPVFLLQAYYWSGPQSVQDIKIYGQSGAVIASGSRRTCCPNDNRAHFNVSRTAAAMRPEAPITVALSLANGSTECRVVADPTRRYD